MKRILTIVGARPQFIKAAAISHTIREKFADSICEEILNREIEYYNHISWVSCETAHVLVLLRFCYRYAATIRFKDRCRLNINLTMGRKEDAPLFPNGTPDNLVFECDRKKRNNALCAMLTALEIVKQKQED
jgi:hypothetical protein